VAFNKGPRFTKLDYYLGIQSSVTWFISCLDLWLLHWNLICYTWVTFTLIWTVWAV